MSTTTTTFHTVRFVVDEEFELRKEVLDKERWKERKAARKLRKKRRMEQKEAQNKELIDVEYVLSFLSSLDANGTREEVFDECGPAVIYVTGIIRIQQAKDALNKILEDFKAAKKEYPLLVRKNYEKNRSMILKIQTLSVTMQEKRIYTNLDRFLQSLFSFDNDLIKKYMLETLGGLDDFLNNVYSGKKEEPTKLENLLERNLTEAVLRKWDEEEYEQKNPTRVTMTGEGEVSTAPKSFPHEAYKRVKAFESLEEVFIKMGLYTRLEAAEDDAIVASSSGDKD